MYWEKGGRCWGIYLPGKTRDVSTRGEGKKGKARKGEERCQEDGEEGHGPAGLAMINSQLNWAYVSMY